MGWIVATCAFCGARTAPPVPDSGQKVHVRCMDCGSIFRVRQTGRTRKKLKCDGATERVYRGK